MGGIGHAGIIPAHGGFVSRFDDVLILTLPWRVKNSSRSAVRGGCYAAVFMDK
jgi:hypothetical protein